MTENNNGTTARLDKETHDILTDEKDKTGIPIYRLIRDAVKAKYSKED